MLGRRSKPRRSERVRDREAAPLCSLGHRERTDFSGAFRSFDKERMRAFLAGAIESTQAAHRAYVEASKPTPGWR